MTDRQTDNKEYADKQTKKSGIPTYIYGHFDIHEDGQISREI